ncbi:MAG: lysostaphin resistance A-like protein [Hyphomicrobiaceae bacterium]
MQPMSLHTFLRGPPAYQSSLGPKLYVAAPIAILLFLVGQLGAGLAYFALGFDPSALYASANVTPGVGTPPSANAITPAQLLIVLMSQVFTVALTLAAALAAPGGVTQALRLGPPDGGNRAYLWAAIVMVPLLAVLNAAAYLLTPGDFLADFRQFLGAVRGNWPVVAALAIGVGAPLSEELLFRGYLLTSATATRIPFWPAAILVNAAWTALHIQYSIVGISEVFVIGLYLSWVTWRTGSLRVPLFCHALYNSSLFLIMRFLPIG